MRRKPKTGSSGPKPKGIEWNRIPEESGEGGFCSIGKLTSLVCDEGHRFGDWHFRRGVEAGRGGHSWSETSVFQSRAENGQEVEH